MKDIEELKKIAVLIDADNAQLSKMKAVLDEISTYGRITVKSAYGDWKKPILKNWEDEMKRLAVKPVQQFAYTTGKNATDIAMVIDAMDMLSTNIYDVFVLVSSDSDFTPLAIRLRESGVYIIGVGEEKT
ncbi:MAG: NYN domain-containing protein, partial [Oscillospiraceae bacterium]